LTRTTDMVSLYIHIPFCKRKCFYCSFYSITDDYREQYIDAIIRCVKFHGGKKIKTLYIGGGTPSILGDRLIPVIESVYKYFDVQKDAEITVEINPESCDRQLLQALKSVGVNRLSIGVQSLCDSELKLIGRLHDSKRALDTILLARECGFDNISCDLIFGLPSQSAQSFKKNIETLKALDIPHISCYNLQIEKGTPIYNTAKPNEALEAQMYEILCESLKDYRHYEISNFCKRGFESRHNSAYWTGDDYLGLGPAAHSKIGSNRYCFKSDINTFINKDNFDFDECERITDPLFEKIMLGLRTDLGVDLKYLQNSEKFILQLEAGGFATRKDGRLILTDKGFYLSNTIISSITAKEC